jgi:hypothetical protein
MRRRLRQTEATAASVAREVRSCSVTWQTGVCHDREARGEAASARCTTGSIVIYIRGTQRDARHKQRAIQQINNPAFALPLSKHRSESLTACRSRAAYGRVAVTEHHHGLSPRRPTGCPWAARAGRSGRAPLTAPLAVATMLAVCARRTPPGKSRRVGIGLSLAGFGMGMVLTASAVRPVASLL